MIPINIPLPDSKIQQAIYNLQRLIFEAVTGKADVREYTN